MQRNRLVFALATAFILCADVDGYGASILCGPTVTNACPAAQARSHEMLTIVSSIQHADYEDDRVALQRSFTQLAPFTTEPQLVAYAHYWRGFAMWRRTINGFNDSVDPHELANDLSTAIKEFQEAEKLDPDFIDAAIGEAGCEMNLIYIHQADPEERRKHLLAAVQLTKRIQAAAPDNPRFLWLVGGSLWVRPPEAGGSQAKAFEAYHHGLAILDSTALPAPDSLEPQWGEPELLMSLAWSSLNASHPNPAAAERYARSALQIVPNWHYVRDILLPQIEKRAQDNASRTPTSSDDVRQIQALHDADARASKAGDFLTLKSLFTADAVVMPPGKNFSRGKQQRDEAMQEAATAMSGWEVIEYNENFEELEILGETEIEWGTVSGVMRAKSPPGAVVTTSYKVMRVLKRQPDGSWKIHRTIWNDGPRESGSITNSAASKEKISVANPVLQFQILSNDPEATARFYAALFDWSADAKNAMGYLRLHTGSDEGIQGGIWPTPPGAPAFVQLFMGVTDLKAALERAAALGAKVLVPPTALPEGGQVAILQDPQGMAFGLWQRAG